MQRNHRFTLTGESLRQKPKINKPEEKPEGTLGTDSRCCADALALPWAFNYRGLPTRCPGLAVHGIGAKARLIKVDPRNETVV